MKTANGHVKALAQPALPDKTRLSWWILAWFYVTAIVCTWDATFIMLRPYTLPGGSLAAGWYLYKYYVTVDQRYQDTEDAYVFAQSLLNYVEVVVNIITIAMHYRYSRHTATTAFMVSVMTFWKTVLYFLMFSEFCTGGMYRHGNTAMEEFFLVVIPNVIWIILPLGVMVALWEQLTPTGQAKVMTSVSNGYGAGEHVGNGTANGHANGGYANGGHVNGVVVNRKVK